MASVQLDAARTRLFTGSYTTVSVTIGPGAGLTFDDLDFVVSDGPAAGLVSRARPRDTAGVQAPEIMLLAGHAPGKYQLRAVHRRTGQVAAAMDYAVIDTWPDEDVGPPLWFSGSQPRHLVNAAWGGGPEGPQNLGVYPSGERRRIAILFVDTASQRYPSDPAQMQSHRDRWLNEVVHGVTGSAQALSTRIWFEEVSYGAFTLEAETFGPVHLPGAFGDYFTAAGNTRPDFMQQCVTAAGGLIDYSRFDVLLCVSQPVPASGSTPVRAAWPTGSLGPRGPFTTPQGHVMLGTISMSCHWGLAHTRQIHKTFCHEMGHVLGLIDQYQPPVPNRNPKFWDIMASDDQLPHLTLVHRMMLGWVRSTWIRAFNFATGGPTNKTVVLSPVEMGEPAQGTYSGIEIRVAGGRNYYLEYRNGESPQIGDRDLPADDRVLGTDVLSPPYDSPMSRPPVLLWRSDGNDSGAVLGNGDFYTEDDVSDELHPTPFRVDVSGIDGSKAEVHIQYGRNDRPDPSIRPWPAGQGREWQSPDIEVRNARTAVDPAWANVPWPGHANTIVARITNGGSVMAPSVRADFHVNDFNLGGAPEALVGSDTHDVPAGATVEFSTVWVPRSTGSSCMNVRIPPYAVPGAPAVTEQTGLNNLARFNYDRFVTAASLSSPSTREVTSVTIGNPYQQPGWVTLVAGQSNPLYRTFLEHTWLRLGPGEVRTVQIMFEYALDLDPSPDRLPPDVRLTPEEVRKYRALPNDIDLRTSLEELHDLLQENVIGPHGGAQIQVTTGRGTRFELFEPDDTHARGLIVTVLGDRPDGGTVLLTLDPGGRDPQMFLYATAPVLDGTFEAKLPAPWSSIWADYLPPPWHAPCSTGWRSR